MDPIKNNFENIFKVQNFNPKSNNSSSKSKSSKSKSNENNFRPLNKVITRKIGKNEKKNTIFSNPKFNVVKYLKNKERSNFISNKIFIPKFKNIWNKIINILYKKRSLTNKKNILSSSHSRGHNYLNFEDKNQLKNTYFYCDFSSSYLNDHNYIENKNQLKNISSYNTDFYSITRSAKDSQIEMNRYNITNNQKLFSDNDDSFYNSSERNQREASTSINNINKAERDFKDLRRSTINTNQFLDKNKTKKYASKTWINDEENNKSIITNNQKLFSDNEDSFYDSSERNQTEVSTSTKNNKNNKIAESFFNANRTIFTSKSFLDELVKKQKREGIKKIFNKSISEKKYMSKEELNNDSGNEDRPEELSQTHNP